MHLPGAKYCNSCRSGAIQSAMRDFLLMGAQFSSVGLIATLYVHVLGLAGRKPPFGYSAFFLAMGAFLAAFAALMAMALIVGDRGERFLRRAFDSCPSWMKWTTGAFFAYAILNLVTFLNRFSTRQELSPDLTMALVFRGTSGEWMVLYSAAFVIFFMLLQQWKREPPPPPEP